MNIVETIESVPCPDCSQELRPGDNASAFCQCGWEGEVYLFHPVRPRSEEAQEAFPADAVCAHHAKKKAVAVCAGSGDYICALCAVELNGRTFSTAYLDGVGKEELEGAFQRHLQRPDYGVFAALAGSIIFIPLALVFIPFAVYQFVQMVRLRRRSPMYRRLVGGGRVALTAVGLVLFGFIGLAVAIAIVGAIANDLSR